MVLMKGSAAVMEPKVPQKTETTTQDSVTKDTRPPITVLSSGGKESTKITKNVEITNDSLIKKNDVITASIPNVKAEPNNDRTTDSPPISSERKDNLKMTDTLWIKVEWQDVAPKLAESEPMKSGLNGDETLDSKRDSFLARQHDKMRIVDVKILTDSDRTNA